MPHPDEVAARLRAAAAAEDLDALHAMVDWELTGAAPLVRALHDVDAEDRADVARRGLAELDLSSRDLELVRSRVGELLRMLASGEIEPSAAGDAVAGVRVPPTPAGLDPEQVRRIDELRARAESVEDTLAISRPHGAAVALAIAPDGERVVLLD